MNPFDQKKGQAEPPQVWNNTGLILAIVDRPLEGWYQKDYISGNLRQEARLSRL
jgi:hypothetical protein